MENENWSTKDDELHNVALMNDVELLAHVQSPRWKERYDDIAEDVHNECVDKGWNVTAYCIDVFREAIVENGLNVFDAATVADVTRRLFALGVFKDKDG